jgi:hypothetical protein
MSHMKHTKYCLILILGLSLPTMVCAANKSAKAVVKKSTKNSKSSKQIVSHNKKIPSKLPEKIILSDENIANFRFPASVTPTGKEKKIKSKKQSSKKVGSGEKKIVAISLAPTSKTEASLPIHKNKKSKKVQREVVEVAFGSTTVESEIEPLSKKEAARVDRKYTVKQEKPKDVVVVAAKENSKELEGRKLASHNQSAKPVSLEKLMQEHKKDFEEEFSDEDSAEISSEDISDE